MHELSSHSATIWGALEAPPVASQAQAQGLARWVAGRQAVVVALRLTLTGPAANAPVLAALLTALGGGPLAALSVSFQPLARWGLTLHGRLFHLPQLASLPLHSIPGHAVGVDMQFPHLTALHTLELSGGMHITNDRGLSGPLPLPPSLTSLALRLPKPQLVQLLEEGALDRVTGLERLTVLLESVEVDVDTSAGELGTSVEALRPLAPRLRALELDAMEANLTLYVPGELATFTRLQELRLSGVVLSKPDVDEGEEEEEEGEPRGGVGRPGPGEDGAGYGAPPTSRPSPASPRWALRAATSR